MTHPVMKSRARPEQELGGARLLTDYLGELEKGRFLIDASQALQRVLQSVVETRKGGTLTLRLSLKPLGGDSEAIEIAGAIATKEPETSRSSTMFFVTSDMNLSRRDPRQGDLEDHLRGIDGSAA